MLNDKQRAKDYMEWQKTLTANFHRPIRNYSFEMAPCIACIDHCVFEPIEKNIVILFKTGQLQNEDRQPKGSAERKRKKLLEYVYRVAPSQIEELNELQRILANAFGTTNAIEALRIRLALRTEDASQNKQTRINRLVFILSIITAVAGGLAIHNSSALHPDSCSHCEYITAWGIIVSPVILCLFYFLSEISINRK